MAVLIIGQADLGQFGFGSPNDPQGQTPNSPQYSQSLGSGFIWDTEGHIVTNNHVVSGADKIEVTFADGTSLPATLVGADPSSDLAVIQVVGAADLMHPVQMADSTQVKVGELAIAIGNPFGLEGTMTVGIVSALGRSLPASETGNQGVSYTIPDIIQTDAPINPGNSGGVLLNDQGQVMGVTAAIASTSNANAGIGFAIPSVLVSKVIPALLKDGHYDHPYLGISAGSLTPDLVAAMGLKVGQRGALVADVVPGSPAEKAGLRGSNRQVTIDGMPVQVGGDVITAINGQPIAKMDDLIAYLADQTQVGQTVTLTILRVSADKEPAQEISVEVTLTARPAQVETSQTPNAESKAGAWLGILGAQLTPEVIQAMDLSKDQQGILIKQVETGSPADNAKLLGSTKTVTLNGQTMLVGGDITTAVEGHAVTTLAELRSAIQQYQSGDVVTLTILRDGKTLPVPVTLADRPARTP